MKIDKEIWKRIPGYGDRYKVSNLGRVKRLERRTKITQKNTKYQFIIPEKILKGTKHKNGYIVVELVGGRRYGIHTLVLMAFIGKCPKGMYCRHLNGVPDDNRLCNLKWGTPTENNRDKIKHGTITNGEKVNTSILTEKQVKQIRKIFNAIPIKRKRVPRNTYTKLSAEFGVCKGAIANIVYRRSWKHVP